MGSLPLGSPHYLLICVYVSLCVSLDSSVAVSTFSTDLPNLGKTGEEKQSFVGQSPKSDLQNTSQKADIQVRCFLPCRLCPCPPRPPAPCMWPCRQEPSPSDSCPPASPPCFPGGDKSLQAWVLPPGPPAYPPSSPVGAWISKPPAGTWGSSHTIKGAAREKSTGGLGSHERTACCLLLPNR